MLFTVRRPLRSKQGNLVQVLKDGLPAEITLNLNWPTLTVSKGGGPAENYPIEKLTVKASPMDDAVHEVSQSFVSNQPRPSM